MANQNFIEKTSIFVDLTNFYSQLIKSKIADENTLRDYFLDWFDFRSISKFLAYEITDVWVFYSGERIGPSRGRIENDYAKNFIIRLNNQSGVTCYNVNIPNDQREPYKVKCEHCGNDSEAISKSEKGIDTSLIVHLFDTANSWDRAFLLSGDGDFVPAVRSLRRMGKIVSGAGFNKNTSSALIRECFEYVDLENYFRDDFKLRSIFASDGIIASAIEKTKDIKEKIYLPSSSEGVFHITLKIQNSYDNPNTASVWISLPKILNQGDKIKSLGQLIQERPTPDNVYTRLSVNFERFQKPTIQNLMKNLCDKFKLTFNSDEISMSIVAKFEWDNQQSVYKKIVD